MSFSAIPRSTSTSTSTPTFIAMVTSPTSTGRNIQMIATPSQEAGRALAFSVVESLGLDDDDYQEEGEVERGRVGYGAISGTYGVGQRQNVPLNGGPRLKYPQLNPNAGTQRQDATYFPVQYPTDQNPIPTIKQQGYPTTRSRAYALGLVPGQNESNGAGVRSSWNARSADGLDHGAGSRQGLPTPTPGAMGVSADGRGYTIGAGSGAGSGSGSGSLSGSASASEEDLVAGFEAYMKGLKLPANTSTVYDSHPTLSTKNGPHFRPQVSSHNSFSSYTSNSSFASWHATGQTDGIGALGNGDYQPEKLAYFGNGGKAGAGPSSRDGSQSSEERDVKQAWEEKDEYKPARTAISLRSTSFVPSQVVTSLSAKAAPFAFKPRIEVEHVEVAQLGATEQPPRMGPIAHPHLETRRPRREETIVPIGMGRKGSHSRARSEIVYGTSANATATATSHVTAQGIINGLKDSMGDRKAAFGASHSNADEGQEVLLDSPLALLPAPRSKTPLPFKRPSYAAQQQAKPKSNGGTGTDGDSLFHSGKRPGLPSLAEMGAKMRAKGVVGAPGQTHEGPQSGSTSPVKPSKRYSVESAESFHSVGSASDEGTVSSSGSESANGNAVPAPAPGTSAPSTPTKSRLPAFLQHRRTESGTSIISSDGQVSPTRSLTFFRDAIAGMRTPESQVDTGCPVLRVIPPTIEAVPGSIPSVPTRARANKRTSSGPALTQAMMEESEEAILTEECQGEEANIPVITCTPATALGAVGASPLAMLEAEVRRQRGGRKI